MSTSDLDASWTLDFSSSEHSDRPKLFSYVIYETHVAPVTALAVFFFFVFFFLAIAGLKTGSQAFS
jgi:hypothetical protein